RLRAAGGCPGSRTRLPRGGAQLRGDAEPRRLVLAARCGAARSTAGRTERQESGGGCCAQNGEGADEGQDEGVREADAWGCGGARGRGIVSDPPLIVPIEELMAEDDARDMTEEIRELIRVYRRSLQRDRRELLEGFRFVHLARKVVGVGSVGTRCWIALFL